jgi:hypothetical protein
MLCVLFVGCGSRDPFRYEQVSGRVTYEDGTTIPMDGLTVVFTPESGPINPKTYPRSGRATVDRVTGQVGEVTSYKPHDGLVRGKHKVTLSAANGMPISASMVPEEYGDPAKTPLVVDTASSPFELRVRKPL